MEEEEKQGVLAVRLPFFHCKGSRKLAPILISVQALQAKQAQLA